MCADPCKNANAVTLKDMHYTILECTTGSRDDTFRLYNVLTNGKLGSVSVWGKCPNNTADDLYNCRVASLDFTEYSCRYLFS